MNETVSPLQILKTLSDATAELVEKTAPSIVTVNCGMARGSGIIWDSDGHIVTCNHVICGHHKVRVGLEKGKVVDAEVIGLDPYSDVALLKIEGNGFKPLELGNSEDVSVGQFVIALANPYNRHPSATIGIVTSVGGSMRSWHGMTIEDVIATDARLNPGYSGGPLIDASGKMIGLSAAYVWSRGIALPVNNVRKIVDRLSRGGSVKKGYLGIISNTIPLPEEVISQRDINQDSGVLVFSVEKNSPAKNAGLALGDVIVRFNDKVVSNVHDLPRLLTEEVIGKKTKLMILRGEKLMELSVTPRAAEDETDD
jgi:S1-C subfamily serine protease